MGGPENGPEQTEKTQTREQYPIADLHEKKKIKKTLATANPRSGGLAFK